MRVVEETKTQLFGLLKHTEQRHYATEQDFVNGLVPTRRHKDVLTHRYIHCVSCQKDQLARLRQYQIGWEPGGVCDYYKNVSIDSCSSCGTLTDPDREHEYEPRGLL